jgi:hAT family C-terminal dimerisation region
MILLDNTTRWNSQYLSISQALKLKERVLIFQTRHSDDLGLDSLNSDDWNQLRDLKRGLFPFLDITNKIQASAVNGQHGSLWEWLPAIEALYGHLEDEIERFKAANEVFTPLAVCTQNAWLKLRKYYADTDKSYHLYAAATIFCPEQRMAYFDRNWKGKLERFKKSMINRVRKEWLQHYKGQAPAPIQRPAVTSEMSIFDRQLGHEYHSPGSDPFDDYVFSAQIKLANKSTFHMLDWWDGPEGPPELKQMAFDLLSIPATSCDLERVFSDTKRMVAPRMNRMTDETMR